MLRYFKYDSNLKFESQIALLCFLDQGKVFKIPDFDVQVKIHNNQANILISYTYNKGPRPSWDRHPKQVGLSPSNK